MSYSLAESPVTSGKFEGNCIFYYMHYPCTTVLFMCTENWRGSKIKIHNVARNCLYKIMDAIQNGKPLSLFMDTRGGTGKAFVMDEILAAVRSLDNGTIGLVVGTTGIATNLL